MDLASLTKGEVAPKPGDYGLKYVIPVRDLPSYEFHLANYEATVNTYHEMNKVAAMNPPPFDIAKAEVERCRWGKYREYGVATVSVAAGYGFGSQFGLQVVPQFAVLAERRAMRVRQVLAYSTAIAFLKLAEHFRLFDPYGEVCAGLTSRTPLGDHCRATYQRELARDMGTLNMFAREVSNFYTAKDAVSGWYDGSNPGSIRNLLVNIGGG